MRLRGWRWRGNGFGFGFRLRVRFAVASGRLTTTTPTTRNPSRDGTTRQRRQQQKTRIDFAQAPPRGFPPCLRHKQLSAVNFPAPGGGYTIWLSESTGRQARSTNTQISIPLWTAAAAAAANPGHWDEAEDTSVHVGYAHPSAIYLYGSGLGGGGCWIGRHGGVRQASHPGYFPLRARPPPLWRLLMFLCLVCGGGCAFLPAERAVVSVPQTARESQAVKSVSLLGRCPPPCRRSEIRLCVRVLPGAGGLRQHNCPAGHGWRWWWWDGCIWVRGPFFVLWG